jgi:hypothetical protein
MNSHYFKVDKLFNLVNKDQMIYFNKVSNGLA